MGLSFNRKHVAITPRNNVSANMLSRNGTFNMAAIIASKGGKGCKSCGG